MKRVLTTTTAFLLLSLAAPIACAQGTSPEQVGRLGDLERIAFTGNDTFAASRIRDALLEDPGFLVAGHPRAPLAAYLKMLQRKVLDGYLRGGFADAAVTVKVDHESERVLVEIVEGRRYRAGDVTVVGARTIPVNALVQRLTEPWEAPVVGAVSAGVTPSLSPVVGASPQPPMACCGPAKAQEPAWKVGKPAQFDEGGRALLKGRIAGVLRALGYFFTEFDVLLAANREQGTAKLVVTVVDEGPPGVISEIAISGNEKNTREDILDYLGLSIGMPVNDEVVRRTERLLWESARFMEHIASVHLSDTTNDVVLTIKLVECEMASPLSTDLSAEQRILLRSIDWLSTVTQRDADVVLSTDYLAGWPIKFILSRRGALLSFEAFPGFIPAFDMAMQPETITLHTPLLARSLVFESPRMQALASLSIMPAPSEGMVHLFFGGGFRWREKGPDLPLAVRVLIAPVALWWFDPQKEGYDHFMDEERSVLTITHEGCRLAVKAESGELVELHCEGLEDQRRFDVVMADGALDEALKRLEAVESVDTVGASGSPIGMVTAFALSAIIRSDIPSHWGFPEVSRETRERAADALARITRHVAASLDTRTARSEDTPDNRFVIPVYMSSVKGSMMQAVYAKLAAQALRIANDLLLEGSWPLAIAREAVFMASGEWQHAGDTLKAVYDSRDTGPVGCLVLARWLVQSNPPLGRRFALRGLERLSIEDFRKDYSLWLEGDSGLVEMLGATAATLADTETEDVEAIAAILPPDMADLLRASVIALRLNRDKPIKQTLIPLLDRAWERTTRAQIERQLLAIAGDDGQGDGARKHEQLTTVRVGEETITASRVWQNLRAEVEASAKHVSASELNQLVWQRAAQLLTQSIAESLLFQKAVWTPTSLAGASLNTYVDSQIDQLVYEKYDGSRENFESYLSDQGQTLEDVRNSILRSLVVSNYLEKVVKPTVEVPSDEELDALVELQRASLRKPERRRMSLIDVRVVVPGGANGSRATEQQMSDARAAARAKAQHAREELEAGADFADVARRYSSGSHAAEGGSWGWVSKEGVRERFQKAVELLFAVDTGMISEVIETPESFFIVRCDERESTQELDPQPIRVQLQEQLVSQRYAQRIQELVAQLRSQVSIDPAELNALHRAVVDRALASTKP